MVEPGVVVVWVVGGVTLVRGVALDTARADTLNKLPRPIAPVRTVEAAFLSLTSMRRSLPLYGHAKQFVSAGPVHWWSVDGPPFIAL
jgi:hypothetical protein